MSPDEDERMERAERIRKLREEGGRGGNRSRNGDTDDETGDDENGDDGTAATASGATGVELPDIDQMEAALAGGDGASAAASDGDSASDGEATVDVGLADADEAEAVSIGASARGGTTTTVHARVLEFTLGEELYCIDIAGVEEIVKRETVTRVPNTPEYVEGVVDLRGQITTILDAKDLLDIEAAGPESLVVVFAPDAFDDQGAVGWVVDEVRQVRPVSEDEIREAPSDDDHVEGIVAHEDDDELVVWVRPEEAIGAATGDGDAT